MKAYFTFVAALMLGSVLLEFKLTEYYKPSVQLLEHTTINEGKFYLSGERNGWVPKVNNVSLVCEVFYGWKSTCPYKVLGLRPGAKLTVAYAEVPTLLGTMPLVISIDTQGVRIYAVTSEQVINNYMTISYNCLHYFPIAILILFVLFPLMFNMNFRGALIQHPLQFVSFALLFLLILYPLIFNDSLKSDLISFYQR